MQTSPTDGQGLKLRPDEFEALAHRWKNLPPEVQADMLSQMNRAQRKRFERTRLQVEEGGKTFASKLTTRQDVVNILAMYTNSQLLPLAARLDAMEAWVRHRESPWHYRLRVAIVAWVARAQAWLETRGIRFTKVGSSPTTPGDSPDSAPPLAGTGPRSTEPEVDATGSGSEPIHGAYMAEVPARPSMIEVVPR